MLPTWSHGEQAGGQAGGAKEPFEAMDTGSLQAPSRAINKTGDRYSGDSQGWSYASNLREGTGAASEFLAEPGKRDKSSTLRKLGKPLEWLLLAPILLYRLLVSPLLPPACRFTPSCSVYAMESIRKHGPLVGLWRSLKRLLRCHPFHPGGHDPP
ncbi:MAG: membrane protein insertion efficiency factor YidD [Polyangia bacterium]|jgi:putative membrane protein insertion efficiency factor|nr:membrane protein insertion efficiency factor YidD [Polyangia bacterium]